MNKWILVAVIAASMLGACTDRTAARKKLDQRTVGVGIMALQWPKVVSQNADFVVTAAVRNVGVQTIPSLGATSDGGLRVNVTYHWKTLDHKMVVWDGMLTPLDSDLVVGGEQAVNLRVRPPPSPGRYILEIDLVQTDAFWFGGVGSQTASMIIDVK